VAVYEYAAMSQDREGHMETGTIVARDKLDAFHKLKQQSYKEIHVRRLEGWSAFFKKMTADIR